jgi:hypothetical protein
MSDDPKTPESGPLGAMPEDLNEIDRAMLSAISHRQRDDTPISFEQERLLDSWIAGRLSSDDADRAAELTKHNKLAAERILERRLVAVANEGPDVPSALSARILRASRPPISGRGALFSLRWPTFSAWQWSGLGAAAAAIAVIAVLGFEVWRVHLQSDQSFQIAMVTIEDRSVLLEGSGYRTRGRQQQDLIPNAPSTPKPENHFRDVEVPTVLLRRALNGASIDKQSSEHSELMTSLRAQNQSLDSQALILIDSLLAESISETAPERSSTQIRVYDLDDPSALAIRRKIRTLPAGAQAILLTLRR